MKILMIYLFIAIIFFIAIAILVNEDEELNEKDPITFMLAIITALLWLPLLIYSLISEVIK